MRNAEKGGEKKKKSTRGEDKRGERRKGRYENASHILKVSSQILWKY